MNKNKFFIWGMVAALLTFGAVFTSCGSSDGGPTGTTTDAATPSITVQPVGDKTYSQGQTADTLSVTATVSDGGALSYQWYESETNSTTGGTAKGTNSASYTPVIPASITTDKDYWYYVVVTNTNTSVNGTQTASVTSNTAKITHSATPIVHAAEPNISTQPVAGPADYKVGATPMDLSVTANSTDSGSITYQWYKNAANNNTAGTLIESATASTYTPSTATTGTTYYYVVVTNTNNGVNGNKTKTLASTTATVTINPYAIGETGPGGGKIFYVSTTGFSSNSVTCHYLEAAPADMGTDLAWADSHKTTSISGTAGTAIGTGAANTAAILAADVNAPAAKTCADYTSNGKSDWFLPSKDELNEMYLKKTQTSISGIYWSSSQSSADAASVQRTDNGGQFGYDKATATKVRAVRAF
jgi:hypothetical protein